MYSPAAAKKTDGDCILAYGRYVSEIILIKKKAWYVKIRRIEIYSIRT